MRALFAFCQKRTSDPSRDGCEPPCGCWELSSEPLEEQPVLLTTEPSLHPLLTVCVCAHTQTLRYIHTQCLCKGQRLMLGVFITLHLISFEKGLSLDLELAHLTTYWSVSQGSSCICLPSRGVTGTLLCT